MRHPLLAATAAAWLAACSTGSDTSASTSSSSSASSSSGGVLPAQPSAPTLGATLPALGDVLGTGAVDGAWVLPGGGVVLSTSHGVDWVAAQGGTATPLSITPLTVHAATLVDGDVLLATSNGLMVSNAQHTLSQSPLGSTIAGNNVRSMVWDGDVLWILSVDALHAWRAGSVRRVEVPDIALDTATMAAGGFVEGGSALWLLSNGVVEAVRLDGATAHAWLLREDLAPKDIAADGEGRIWLRLEGGDLHVQDWEGHWQWLRFPAPVDQVLGDAHAPELWVRAGSQWWLAVNGTARPTTDVPDGAVLAQGSGRLVVQAGGDVRLVRARRRVSLSGLPSGVPVSASTPLTLATEGAATPSWTLDVDGRDITVEGNAATLDPIVAGVGTHALHLRATYMDGALDSATHVFPFVVDGIHVPSWNGDIQPLFHAQCERCHGSVPGATARRLDSRQAWMDQITGIVSQVSSGSMPLGGMALGPQDVALIVDWQHAGFPE